jgi:AraC family transcriptional regulator
LTEVKEQHFSRRTRDRQKISVPSIVRERLAGRSGCMREIWMGERGAYGSRLGDRFGLPDAPAFITRSLHKAPIAVTQIKGGGERPVLTTPIAREDAFLVALQLRDCVDHELWFDERPVRVPAYLAGLTSFYDLKRNPIAYMGSAFHSLMFYLPRKSLDAIADQEGTAPIDGLRLKPGIAADDAVIRSLGSAMLSAFEHPDHASRLFVDHVTLALAGHVAQTYGGLKVAPMPTRGGLAPWQERRVNELLDANLDGDISVMLLADACGLSSRHFSRAFRKTTRLSPHQWLLKRRVDKATQILRNPHIALADVAIACGFFDQSHFTRVFTRWVGSSPGQWRRAHRN